MTSFASPPEYGDIFISEQLIGRLHGATDDSVLELVISLKASQRAILAMHCYRKSHLRKTGLMIATTCDLSSLVKECGPLIGEAIFAQSRRCSEETERLSARRRPTITLASSSGVRYPPPVDTDDPPPVDTDDPPPVDVDDVPGTAV
jgi:hypothetical protein